MLHEYLYVAKFSINHIVPIPIISVTALNDNLIIGTPFSVQCTVTVVKGITGSVDIIWTVSGGKQNNTVNNNTVTAWDMNSEYVSIYNISQLQVDDNNTMYCCKVVISGKFTDEKCSNKINIRVGKYCNYIAS